MTEPRKPGRPRIDAKLRLTDAVEVRFRKADIEWLEQYADEESMRSISEAVRRCVNTARRIRLARK